MKELLLTLTLFISTCFAQPIPGVGGMLPTSGSGNGPQTFTATMNLPAGPGNGDYMLISIGGWTPGCVVMIRPLDNIMYILNDAGTGWQSPATIGSNVIIQNNVCIANAGATFKWVYSNSEVAATSLSFKLGFSGSNPGWAGVYAYSGATNTTSNWVTTGSWTVPNTSLSTPSASDLDLTKMLGSDTSVDPVRNPTTTQPWAVVKTTHRDVLVANASNIKVKSATASHEPLADSFVYHFKVDTTDPDLWGFRLGIPEDTFWMNDFDNTLSVPKGWHGSVFAWATDSPEAAERSEQSEFVIRSKWRPGLIPMYLVSERAKEPTPTFPDTASNEKVGAATSIFSNSVQKFVIGPAIKPDITKAELDELVQRWVDGYGFEFLKPVTEGKSVFDILPPESEFEKSILQCLRDVTPEGK